jgi:hypothetical protein
MAVFIPRTAPGDVVDASLDVRGRFARGAIRAIVEPSLDRVDPPCVHYTRDHCGGCQLQHLSYVAQLRAKSAIVRDAMQRIGKRDVEPVDVRPSPSEWAYRTKLTLAMRWRGDRLIAGLHPFDKPDAIFQLEECLITDDTGRRDLEADSLRSHRCCHAPRSFVARFVSRRMARRSCSREWATGLTRLRSRDRVPELTTVWWEPPVNAVGCSWTGARIREAIPRPARSHRTLPSHR